MSLSSLFSRSQLDFLHPLLLVIVSFEHSILHASGNSATPARKTSLLLHCGVRTSPLYLQVVPADKSEQRSAWSTAPSANNLSLICLHTLPLVAVLFVVFGGMAGHAIRSLAGSSTSI